MSGRGRAGAAGIWACAAGVAYTYAGYPLLVRALATWRPRPVHRAPGTPACTVVVPAYNEAGTIEAKVRNALALDYPREALEVLVVDDGSTDATAALAAGAAERGARVLRQARAGKAAAVNAGVAEARGEIVVLSDATAMWSPDAVRVAATYFADPHVGAVSGRIAFVDEGGTVEAGAGLYQRYEDRLRAWESATGSTVGVNGNFFAFRRDLFLPLPSGTVNDEFTIAMRIAGAGRRVVFAPDVVALDTAAPSMAGERARRARIGAGRYQALLGTGLLRLRPGLTVRVVSHKLSRAVAPLLLAGLAALSAGRRATPAPARWWRACASWRGAPLRVLQSAQVLVYGLAAAGALGEGRAWARRKVVSVPHYFVAGNVAAAAGLVRHLRGGQAATWEHPAGPAP